ncbi:hypothetical protein BKA70DRAFT_1239157 [Coprinopsis sp. MPI-PUGE-AT-0042]|nr:hypothetical protein BKA70DRAFT_1239157 [Coprinopsis sp. MPI-PUGE-AT-0042]
MDSKSPSISESAADPTQASSNSSRDLPMPLTASNLAHLDTPSDDDPNATVSLFCIKVVGSGFILNRVDLARDATPTPGGATQEPEPILNPIPSLLFPPPPPIPGHCLICTCDIAASPAQPRVFPQASLPTSAPYGNLCSDASEWQLTFVSDALETLLRFVDDIRHKPGDNELHHCQIRRNIEFQCFNDRGVCPLQDLLGAHSAFVAFEWVELIYDYVRTVGSSLDNATIAAFHHLVVILTSPESPSHPPQAQAATSAQDDLQVIGVQDDAAIGVQDDAAIVVQDDAGIDDIYETASESNARAQAAIGDSYPTAIDPHTHAYTQTEPYAQTESDPLAQAESDPLVHTESGLHTPGPADEREPGPLVNTISPMLSYDLQSQKGLMNLGVAASAGHFEVGSRPTASKAPSLAPSSGLSEKPERHGIALVAFHKSLNIIPRYHLRRCQCSIAAFSHSPVHGIVPSPFWLPSLLAPHPALMFHPDLPLSRNMYVGDTLSKNRIIAEYPSPRQSGVVQESDAVPKPKKTQKPHLMHRFPPKAFAKSLPGDTAATSEKVLTEKIPARPRRSTRQLTKVVKAVLKEDGDDAT